MDREKVIEAMAGALWAEFVRQHLRSEDWPTWGELRAQGHQGLGRVGQFKALARAALAVAEPAVRADCATAAKITILTNGGAWGVVDALADKVEAAIRTGGTP